MAKDMTNVEYMAVGLMLSGAVGIIDKEFFSDATARSIAGAIASGDRETVVKAMRHLLHLSTKEPVAVQLLRAVEANGRARRINVLLARAGDALKIGDAQTANDTLKLLQSIADGMGVKHG